jgi:hypothetical protein
MPRSATSVWKAPETTSRAGRSGSWAHVPNLQWVVDITFVPTRSRLLDVAVVLDA